MLQLECPGITVAFFKLEAMFERSSGRVAELHFKVLRLNSKSNTGHDTRWIAMILI